jgi:hypothetical protein
VIVLKKLQILFTIAFVISIISSSVYATEANTELEQNNTVEQNTATLKAREKNHQKCDKCDKDPLKMLEERKQKIEKEYKEGKITKEEADEKTKKIDERISKIKEFNSLSLPKKKEYLSSTVKSRVEQDVKSGKITKEQGEKIIKDFNEKLEKWDGKDFPGFMGKGERPPKR